MTNILYIRGLTARLVLINGVELTKDDLQDVIDIALEQNSVLYTAPSWAILTTAIQNGSTVIDIPDPSVSQIRAAITAIENALRDLVSV
jgi:hypothetical protein